MRAAQDRALDAENVERFFAAFDARENVEDLLAGLLADARMPEQVDAEASSARRTSPRAPCSERRHGAAAARAGLQPQQGLAFFGHAADLAAFAANINGLASEKPAPSLDVSTIAH